MSEREKIYKIDNGWKKTEEKEIGKRTTEEKEENDEEEEEKGDIEKKESA